LKNIVIIAKIKVKEEFVNEIYEELVELHKQTHKNDEGCIYYEMHKDLEDKTSFTFVETWESAELLDAHMQKEHFLVFIKNSENKLDNLEISKLEKIES
jgi:quinol monooxygenase YgiN